MHPTPENHRNSLGILCIGIGKSILDFESVEMLLRFGCLAELSMCALPLGMYVNICVVCYIGIVLMTSSGFKKELYPCTMRGKLGAQDSKK